MVSKKKDRGLDERLDRMGREIVRASAANDVEAERVASSPFLYTRLRSRINAEVKRREEGEGWLAMLAVAWRAVPAMALTAIFAFALFWSSANLGVPTATVALSDEALVGSSDAEIERMVFADRQPLSSDEVLATIINEEPEVSR